MTQAFEAGNVDLYHRMQEKPGTYNRWFSNFQRAGTFWLMYLLLCPSQSTYLNGSPRASASNPIVPASLLMRWVIIKLVERHT